mmetsp:Transcript_6837/g.21561  ORF Transcript_6837/g.21561 Transcript_6837/m.21561 type:complete len:309 (+) Transcript_6837:343-1269(+)
MASGLTPHERFLFDLNGYLVVRGALSTDEVAALNAAVDAHESDAVSRDATALRNAKRVGAFGAKGSRRDLGGMLHWEEPGFRELLAHPKLAPYVTALCGAGYRLDHQPMVLLQDGGSEGFSLHGGPMRSDEEFNPELQYRCVAGKPWNTLVAMSAHLVDAPAGAGGFCVVKGSHKSNFAVPPEWCAGLDADFAREHVYQVETKAGDVVFFSEATVHGALPWTAPYERRLALYRFANANYAYGRAYLNAWGGAAEKCTPAQRAVLEPPFAPRLERPMAPAEGDDGEVVVATRAAEKKAHDVSVFGTDYF